MGLKRFRNVKLQETLKSVREYNKANEMDKTKLKNRGIIKIINDRRKLRKEEKLQSRYNKSITRARTEIKKKYNKKFAEVQDEFYNDEISYKKFEKQRNKIDYKEQKEYYKQGIIDEKPENLTWKNVKNTVAKARDAVVNTGKNIIALPGKAWNGIKNIGRTIRGKTPLMLNAGKQVFKTVGKYTAKGVKRVAIEGTKLPIKGYKSAAKVGQMFKNAGKGIKKGAKAVKEVAKDIKFQAEYEMLLKEEEKEKRRAEKAKISPPATIDHEAAMQKSNDVNSQEQYIAKPIQTERRY